MNKKLAPLQAFENIIVDLTPHLKNANTEEIKIVKNTLKNVERLKSTYGNLDNVNYLLEKENKYYKKALEIIKNKRVDVGWFIECLSCGKPLEVYNDRYDKIRSYDGKDYHFMQLTQEEYDLLKEVLKDE